MRGDLVAVLMALGLLAAGCCPQAPQIRIEHDSRRPLVFAMVPFADRASLEEAVGPLTDYLGRTVGHPVRFRVMSSYTELDWAIAQGRIDLGWFAPRTASGGPAGGEMEVLCRAVPVGGHPARGVIVARKGLDRLEALAGKRFAYVDRRSRSGFLLPNRLLAARGLDPIRFFARIEFAGNHERVLERILSGEADAGAVSEAALGQLGKAGAGRLSVLGTTEPIPPDPLLALKSLDGDSKRRLAAAARGLDKDPSAREVLVTLGRTMGIERFE